MLCGCSGNEQSEPVSTDTQTSDAEKEMPKDDKGKTEIDIGDIHVELVALSSLEQENLDATYIFDKTSDIQPLVRFASNLGYQMSESAADEMGWYVCSNFGSEWDNMTLYGFHRSTTILAEADFCQLTHLRPLL
jgi:hypothetical protein